MSRATTAPVLAPPPAPPRPAPLPLRPTLFDFFIILLGASASLALFQFRLIRVLPSSAGAAWSGTAMTLPLLEQMLHLSEGIILMWPFFLGIQRLRGRTQGLTLMEWLWVFAWVGTALVAGLGAWNHWVGIPVDVLGPMRSVCLVWYVILGPSMALLALVIALLGMVVRVPPPWTHSCGIALVVWPVLPLAGILALGKFI
jgi:hypothetical protein